MDLTVVLPPEPTERWELARQMGLDHAVAQFRLDGDGQKPWEFEPLLELKNRYADAGFEVDVLEALPPLQKAILGEPGAEEQIGWAKTLLRNMGRVGIGVWCYNWMAPFFVLRTSASVRGRGGSLTTRYEHDQMERGPRVRGASEETLWNSLERFLDEVIPVAEEAGVKLALHPDDPPLGPIRGVNRIITSVEHYDRVLSLNDSEHNGITMCQGNFAAMGADIPEVIRHFGDRIHFAHFRDVIGTSESFTEVWHDEGPTDMAAAIRAYEEIGFDGSIRPDHTPTMAGEDNVNPGYHNKGRLFAIGYMKGLRDQYHSLQSAGG